MFCKNLCLSTICVLAFFGVSGQRNFKPAYVVNNSGDTVKGSIDYRHWDKNPERISFKGSNGNTEEYLPLTIKGFFVEGNHYESAIVDVEQSPTQLRDLDHSHALILKKDTVFLQKLIDGPKSLYGFVIKAAREQFYIRENNKLELLGFKKYMKDLDPSATSFSKEFQGTNSIYLNQLSLYCKDCPDAMKFLEPVKYKRKDLITFFNKYYKCKGKGMDYAYEVDKIRVQTGAIVGYTLTSFNIESDQPKYAQLQFSNSSSISGGFTFDLMLAKKFRKFSIYNELFFSYYKLNDTINYYLNENEYTNTVYSLEYSYLNINTMLRYRFLIGRDKALFINGGLANGFVISETNQFVQYRQFYGTERTKEGVILEDTRQREFSYLIGLGLSVRKFSFETRLQTGGHGISLYPEVGTEVNRLHFLFGYRF